MNAPVDRFRELLSRRFGWRLDDDRGQLTQLLASRLRGRTSPDAYLAMLADAPQSAAELRDLAEELAVSETYFFRNPEQFAVLGEIALPALAQQRHSGPIRILSAGAASGEEAYSIAMTVLKARERHALSVDVEIAGVDVSRRAISRARRGRYSAWALRGLPAALKADFFEHDGKHFDVAPRVRAMVQFHEANLLDLRTAAPGRWDIVFFRNTFMYFTPDVARTVFARLAEVMAPGSFLFLGHAETLRGVSDAFALCHSHDTFYYQRTPALAARVEIAAAAVLPPPPLAAPEGTTNDEWFHEIARATRRVAELVDGPRVPASAAAPPRTVSSCERGVADAMQLLAEERYQAALDTLGNGAEPERLLLRGLLLVNLGRIDEARATCAGLIAVDGVNAGAHYVLALCAERAQEHELAVRHDEMALYLDDTFAMPHLHAATLARRRGDSAAARHHTARACELLSAEDDLRIRLFGGGFTRQTLVAMCESQLRALAS